MASKAEITQSLLTEFGKQDDAVRIQVEQWVGEVTVDLLSQNQGRFEKLLKSQTITVVDGTSAYKLNSDFNTVHPVFYQVDSSGNYVRKLSVFTKAEVFERKSSDAYNGPRMGFVEYQGDGDDGPGFYLVLGDEPSADDAGTYVLFYYRTSTENDTEIIRNDSIIKMGVRGLAVDYNQNAPVHAATFLNMRRGFVEDPSKRSHGMAIRPSKQTQGHNHRMRRIGEGG